jgi:hypothetical protein
MTRPMSLPAHPSQEFLRKQAKKLARDIDAGDAAAMARARAQLPNAELPLSHRDAQRVIAREYGYAGWQDLTAEVLKRLGKGLEWAGDQAERAIHDNDLQRLKQLIAEYPALLSWGAEHGGLVGRAAHCYAMDAWGPERERSFTRPECAEFLIDSGALVLPWVTEGFLSSRTRNLLQLFARKGLLPRTLRFMAAIGDADGVRACLSDDVEPDAVNEAFMTACAFKQESIASMLLQRAIGISPELGRQIDGWQGRSAFIEYMCEHSVRTPNEARIAPWQAFLRHRVMRAIGEGDLPEFTRLLHAEPWLIGESNRHFEVELIGNAVMNDRAQFIERIFELDPGLLQHRPPPPSGALALAFTYAKGHLVPLLTRVWPLPDDLPHAAGAGDFEKVRKWFDASGAPALGDPTHHFPDHKPRVRSELHWSPPTVQRVLDTALAWAVLNRHFEIADFLLQHGADINTRWSSHEPSSILHELVFHGDYEAMRFLIDRGIDMTLTDYRWGGTAQGWAYHAAKDEAMTQWLGEAEQQRGSASANERDQGPQPLGTPGEG